MPLKENNTHICAIYLRGLVAHLCYLFERFGGTFVLFIGEVLLHICAIYLRGFIAHLCYLFKRFGRTFVLFI